VSNQRDDLADFAAEPPSGSAVQAPPDEEVLAGAPTQAVQAVAIPAALLQELIDWARAGLPNEACGIIVGDRTAGEGGHPLRLVGLTNAAASPTRYLIDPTEQLQAITALEEAGEALWAIFHSHVASAAEPSRTDVGLALWPGSLYLICSLAHDERPVIRAWSIEDGQVAEVTLEVA
jgi:[CysO sulfur-carrier protein]-S-L-cysteine hydrolase